ncbi:MAG: hypothetical protein KKD77_24345 [Gammaproteobacteria bacterium]|nr:hypothetical protein [Gammaproteobacteria bacterium]
MTKKEKIDGWLYECKHNHLVTLDADDLMELIAALAEREREMEANISDLLIAKNEQIAEMDVENDRLRKRLSVAEDVVSHLVIWGAAPTDALAALVEKAMTLRMRDKETLCIPSAVKEALWGGEVEDGLL